jgi:hypothetical protein
LFPPRSEENFYWTHPALDLVASAKSFYTAEQWHNSGGDRTWIAPEADVFFPKFPELDQYCQQRALDPGHYLVKELKGGFQLINRLSLKLSRSGRNVGLKITKAVGPAKNPLRYEQELTVNGVDYAGYTQSTSLELIGASKATREQVGLWNLSQMPHGGDLLLPTFGRAQPRHIFNTLGTIPPQDLITTDHLIRYRMRQKGEHKISVRAVSACNRIGYLHQIDDRWSLIIRNFVVNPSGEYVDVPWTDPDDFGFAVQACNVNSHLGTYSEFEYHVPAIGHGTGFTRCVDTAQVWAYRGSQSQIALIAKTLLGSSTHHEN